MISNCDILELHSVTMQEVVIESNYKARLGKEHIITLSIQTHQRRRNVSRIFQIFCPTGIIVSSCICKEENITNQYVISNMCEITALVLLMRTFVMTLYPQCLPDQ
jgi:hypothetical protein